MTRPYLREQSGAESGELGQQRLQVALEADFMRLAGHRLLLEVVRMRLGLRQLIVGRGAPRTLAYHGRVDRCCEASQISFRENPLAEAATSMAAQVLVDEGAILAARDAELCRARPRLADGGSRSSSVEQETRLKA